MYFLLIEKDLLECRNVSVKFPCVCSEISSLFRYDLPPTIPIFVLSVLRYARDHIDMIRVKECGISTYHLFTQKAEKKVVIYDMYTPGRPSS